MEKKYKFLILILLLIIGVVLAIFFFHGHNFAVLNPKGVIASKERRLMVTATLLMLIVVIPVFILLFFFAWKYRAGNTTAKYSPNLDSNATAVLLWLIPTAIIFVIGILNWKSTHELDPYKPIVSDKKPLTIQVVALQWKWLFIYPEQNIATVNYIQFPANTPLNFELTSDAPMNSFWIPQLGGQMYAMPGMETHLHLMANQNDEFNGSTAEISGAGFAGMKFVAKATSQADFDSWIKQTKQSSYKLDTSEYRRLLQPSKDNQPAFYTLIDSNLYNNVIMKFMMPEKTQAKPSTTDMEGIQ